MLKYCLDKWNENRKHLEERIKGDCELNQCNYTYLVKLVVNHILNRDTHNDDISWSADEITTIDNGSYQGTLLFLIPMKRYQPCEYEYLMTFVNYGSCTVCDTLQGIQGWKKVPPTPEQVKDYMTLCKDILTNMIKPYNRGWRFETDFREVEQ